MGYGKTGGLTDAQTALLNAALQPADVGTAAAEDVAAGGTGDLLRADGSGASLTGLSTDITTVVTTAAERLDGSPVMYRGGRLVNRYIETFNQSRDAAALIAAGWTSSTPGTSTISEGASYLSIVAPVGQSCDWFDNGGAVYNAPRIYRSIVPRNGIWWVSYEAPDTADCGLFLGLRFDNTDASFVTVTQLKAAATNLFIGRRGPGTDVVNTSTSVNTTGHFGIRFQVGGSGILVRYMDSANAPGTRPTVDDWTLRASYLATWNPYKITVMLGVLNFGTLPGCTAKFYEYGEDVL